jgi:hypothetical protein
MSEIVPPAPMPCDQFQRDVEVMGRQVLSPIPLRSRYGSDDINSWTLVNAYTPESDASSDSPNIEFRCSRCNLPYSLHFASVDAFRPSSPAQSQPRSILNSHESSPASATWQLPTSTRHDDGAWKWVARSFLACMKLSCGDETLSSLSLVDAATEFERMLQNEDPLLLTATQLVATMLAMHSQGDIAKRVLQASSDVCERLRSHDDPVRIIVTLWTDNAKDGGLKESDIDSDSVRGAYDQLLRTLGESHPYTIQASYAYGWLLKYEGDAAMAETVLEKTYQLSCSVFCPQHLQSIFALASLAGAQMFLDKKEQAMRHFETVIRDASSTLGPSHPYTLEAKRRLGVLILEQEAAEDITIPSQQVEQLYWDVLAGRVKMLGRRHDYTLQARIDYETVCKDRGVWVERERRVKVLFREDKTHSDRRRRRSVSASDAGSIHEAY